MLFSSLREKSAITVLLPVLLPTLVFVLKCFLVRDIKQGRKPFYADASCQWYESGREDLNLRPPQPHCGALPGCATPRYWNKSSIADNSPHSQGFMAGDHSIKYARNCCTSVNPRWCALAAIRWESKLLDTTGTNFDLLLKQLVLASYVSKPHSDLAPECR